MNIVFLGTGDFAVPALRALAGAGHNVVSVISQPDRKAGRGLKVKPTPVHAAADDLGLSHIQTADANALDLSRTFDAAEIGVVAAFGQKIGAAVLDALPRGCINIHGSLLPKYRGAAPFQWAIINGEQTTGVTVFQLDQGWDTGPIWSQRELSIGETETAEELHDRLAQLGGEVITDALVGIENGSIQPQQQDAANATRAPKLSRADAVVDWLQASPRIARRINGLWSWPAASCTFASQSGKRERLQLARARVADAEIVASEQTPPGAFCDDGSVQAGRGRVRLLEVKPSGGKRMSFEAFANGRRVHPPDRLLPLESS